MPEPTQSIFKHLPSSPLPLTLPLGPRHLIPCISEYSEPPLLIVRLMLDSWRSLSLTSTLPTGWALRRHIKSILRFAIVTRSAYDDRIVTTLCKFMDLRNALASGTSGLPSSPPLCISFAHYQFQHLAPRRSSACLEPVPIPSLRSLHRTLSSSNYECGVCPSGRRRWTWWGDESLAHTHTHQRIVVHFMMVF